MEIITDEQKISIQCRLESMHLSEFREFFETFVSTGDYELGLTFVDAVKAKVEKEAREKLIELQNMRLASITGGLRWRGENDPLDY